MVRPIEEKSVLQVPSVSGDGQEYDEFCCRETYFYCKILKHAVDSSMSINVFFTCMYDHYM